MPPAEQQPRTPELLDQIEERIGGLSFFADPNLEELAHRSPGALPQDELIARLPLYTAGARLLVEERRAVRAGTADSPEFQAHAKEQVADIRGGLMLLDPGLQTPVVRGLRAAIVKMNEVHNPDGQRNRHRRMPADVLRPDLMPVIAVDAMLKVGRGSTYVSLGHHGIEPAARLKLPGPARTEVCVDWGFISGMAKRHGFRDPDFTIDWERLPQGPEDTDPERVAYARDIQKRYVAGYKLANIPDLQEELGPDAQSAAKLPKAQPQHISQSTLSRLMGGGYHFATSYCTDNRINFRYLQRPDGFGGGHFLVLEDAAVVWHAFNQIPRAGSTDVSVIDLTRRLGLVLRRAATAALLPQERKQVALMRAVKPAGRVLEHVPAEVAEQIEARAAPITLPPHLLPVNVLDRLVTTSYSGIVQRFSRTPEHPATPLRLLGARQTHNCHDWQAVRHLTDEGRKARMELDWSRLPRGPHEPDPDRIAYARSIQQKLVPPKMLDPEAATRTDIPVFDGQERPSIPVEAITGPLTVPYRPHMRLLDRALEQLPESGRPSLADAITFLERHGEGLVLTDRGLCLSSVGAGLLNHNFAPETHPPQEVVSGWLSREQLADRTGQELGQIDADLASLDWAALRPELVPIHQRTSLSRPTRPVFLHVLWGLAEGGDGTVLPHYNPTIVARIDTMAAERVALAKQRVRDQRAAAAATPPSPSPQ